VRGTYFPVLRKPFLASDLMNQIRSRWPPSAAHRSAHRSARARRRLR